jgi:8-oxo-dGTP diphosphatase
VHTKTLPREQAKVKEPPGRYCRAVAGRTIRCVGAIVHDPDGRLLLIRRGREPALGLWSLPGGRVEPGEDDATAVIREVAEETGLVVAAGGRIGWVVRDAPGGDLYEIHDYACTVTSGQARAADDADDAGWFTPAELAGLPTTPGLVEALTEWGVLG